MKITTAIIKKLIKEELSSLLRENEANPLTSLVASKMKDEEVDQYGQMVEQHIEDLLNTHLNQQDIQDSTQLSKMEQLRKVDPRGVLELLRMLFYDFDEQEQEKLSVIDEWPHNSEFKDKKDFLVNQKMQDMEYNDLLIKNIFFGYLKALINTFVFFSKM